MDRSLIERYAAGAEVPGQAIAGLSPTDLDAFPVPGTWSIRQIVAHLADSDLIASDRMKRIIAEDRPLITAYNETLFSQRLGYERTDADAACRLFALNRRLTADMLRGLADDAFERIGIHTERGAITAGDLVRTYVDHLAHHVAFIRHKRSLLGK